MTKKSDLLPSSQSPHVVNVQREINWPLLMERRPAILAALGSKSKFNYLLLPEVNQLIDAAKHTQDRFAVATLWYTGVRISELLQLRPDDLNIQKPDYGFFTVNGVKTKVDNATRVIELDDQWFIDLAEVYIKSHGIQKNHLLFHSKSKPRHALSRSTINRRLEKCASHCNFPISITPHTLRHSFAINALLHGVDIKTVQTWLGHSDSRTTEIYLKVLSGDVGFKMQNVRYR